MLLMKISTVVVLPLLYDRGTYIKDCFENIMNEFSIDKSKIVNFLTDNSSNMVAAVNLFLGKKKRIPYVAHTINLIIEIVLKNNTNFSNLADQIKCIVTYFKHSVIVRSN